MRSLLIAFDGSVQIVVLPYRFRHLDYLVSDPLPVNARYDVWTFPIRLNTRIFRWRGTINRASGEEVIDFFEEVK